MLTVSMSCSRCGLEVEVEINDIDKTIKHYIIDEDFDYIYAGGINRLACGKCRLGYVEFQNNLEKEMEQKYCDFFVVDCKEKDDVRNNRGTEDE